MRDENGKVSFGIMIFLTLLSGIVTVITGNMYLIILTTICGIIAASGVFDTPNDPPSIATISIWGKRTDEVYREGFGFLFLRGIRSKPIFTDVREKNIDFPEQIVTTPDNATVRVEISLSYAPDLDNIINYLNVGKEHGVQNMLNDIVFEKLRVWARNTKEEPLTWEHLINASNDAVKMIISEICGTDLDDTDISKIRQGNGHWSIPHLGIFLIRLNIKKMEPFGEVYEATINLNKEEAERKSETYETQTELNKAKLLKEKFEEQDVHKSIDECLELIMKWKIQREANAQISVSSIAQIIANSINKGGK